MKQILLLFLFTTISFYGWSQAHTTPYWTHDLDLRLGGPQGEFNTVPSTRCENGGTNCWNTCGDGVPFSQGWRIYPTPQCAGSYTGTITTPNTGSMDDGFIFYATPGTSQGNSFCIQQNANTYSFLPSDFGCLPYGLTSAQLSYVNVWTSVLALSNLGSFSERCQNDAPLDLTNYVEVQRGGPGLSFNPKGATFFANGGTISGPGVVNGIFTPATAGVGTHTIVVTYPFMNGTFSQNFVITVRPLPTLNFSAPDALCSDAGIINLALYYSGTPGTFSSTSPGFSAPSFFNPATATIGNNTVTLSVNNGFNCNAQATETINVIIAYSISAGSNQQVCKNSAAIELGGGSFPSGGTWSGTGVTGTKFDPSGLSPGLFTITYTTNVNGCVKSATKTVQILDLPTVEAGVDLVACDNAGTVTLNTAGVSPTGGTWSFSNSSLNFRINNGSGTVSVNDLPAGDYTLIYSSTNANNCTNTDTRNLKINARPVVEAGLNEQVCANASNFTLSTFSPAGGTWTGTGIIPASATFSPSTAGVGTFTLTYTFTDANGCTNTDTKEVVVNALPTVNAGSDFAACLTGAAIALSGSPVGGTWSGPGVTSGNFTPSVAGIGTHNLTYSYTNSVTGCTKTDIVVATVNNGPAVNAGLDLNVCEGGSAITLSGAAPAGGTWSGTGVNAGQFNPILSGLGTFTITYSYSDFNGCSGTDTRTITVNANPTVEAGNNLQLCLNGGNINLNDPSVSPAGGVWSGTGVTGNSFNPLSAGSGNHLVTYTFTNAQGCSKAETREIFIFSTTPVNAGSDLQVCATQSSLTLTGQSPNGGTWSGTSVSGNVFNPTTAGVGVFVITYTYTDGNGCPNLDTRDITVLASPTVNAGGNQIACVSSTSLQLTGASPANGTWSGPNVLGDIFNPSVAGVGSYTVTYTITNGNGCSNSSTKTVTVNPLPVVTVPAGFEACVNGTNISLTGATPTGGTWSGPGVTSGQFNPGSAGVGNQVLTYTYTNGQGCTNTASMNVIVNALPTVNAGIDIGTCANVTNLTLTGASPLGGTWSGPGVVGTVFNATTAGIGTHIIRYTVTDGKGCTNYDERNVTVTSSPNVDGGTDQTTCLNVAAFTITGGSPGGGTWSGPGVFSNTFDPSVAGVGTHVLTYSFNNGAGCNGTDTKSIQVRDIPVVNAGSDGQYCINAGIQSLTGASPAGGVWSGPGITGTTFNPFSAGAGTHILTYSFTSVQGCINTDTRQVLVFSAPTVDAGIDLTTCVNETALTLTGASPAGGVWTGTGVSGNIFNANLAGVGVFIITYTFTDGNNCAVGDTRTITVNTLPTVNAGTDFGVCINTPSLLLSGFTPTGGTWTGPGIAGGNFNPALAGVGIHVLTYSYSTGNGCTVADQRNVTVSALPTVNAGSDLTLCANAAITNLTGATPAGGVWSGSGIVGSSFNPAAVGAGIYEAIYTYTNSSTGCASSDSKQIVVNAVPTVNAGLDLQLCATDVINLTGGSPGGGTWSGLGVTGNQFKAVDAGPGTQTITYTVIGGNGCQNSDTRDITVNPLPSVNAGGDIVVCINTPAFSISGGTPFNGIWSGNGVNSNSFNPLTAGVGNHDLIYTVTDAKGCINTDIKRITVTALPIVNAGVDQTVCQNEGIISLTGFSPVGGIWTGNGISGSTFNPLTTGIGSYTLTYSFTDGSGCAGSDTKTIIVNAVPTVNAGTDLSRCISDTFTLTGASPAGGSWSGPGVVGNIFTASVAGLGTHIVSYTYTNAQNCSVTDTREITINALPIVNAGNDLVTCKNQTITLNDGSPASGTWSGSGVSGTTFNPAAVSAGVYDITYTYTNTSGCQASDVRKITVNALPTVDAGTDLTVCVNSNIVVLTGQTPSGGSWSGPGIAGSTFNPSSAGIGSFVLTYNYIDVNGCSASDTRNVIVNSLPTANAGLDLIKCINDVFTLTGANPAGGVWSGNGVSGNVFTATNAGLGTHTITYTVTGGNGCQNFDTRDITVNAVPVVDAGIDLITCQNQNITLTDGSPFNGVWSGPGVSGNVFNASTAGPGQSIITYTYTNPTTGCSASDTRKINVNSLPVVNAGAGQTFCVNDGVILLSGATPTGGVWTGTGIVGSTWNPSTAGVGVHILTYSYTDGNSCVKTATREMIVNSLPTVNAGSDIAICNGTSITLTGASPGGGVWSGPGVTGNVFNSVTAGIGTATITYTVIGANGCTGSDTRNVEVKTIATVQAGTNFEICIGSSATAITGGSPGGGTWSGNGVSGNQFIPSSAGLGNHTLTYTYSENGCNGTATKTVSVVNNPTVTAGSDLAVCVDGGILALTGGTPANGVWSGPGVTGSNFNPTTAGVGVQIITYTYSSGFGCTGSSTRQITVRARPTVSAGSNTQVCAGQTVNLNGANPTGGTWTGNGVSGNSFNATIAGIGTTTLTYTVTDANGCTNSATRQIEVLALPTVLSGADQLTCLNGGLLTLQDGVPSGGIWTGLGVSNGRLDPQITGVGTFSVTYTFINGQGCSNSATKNVQVRAVPTVNAGNDQSYCLNSDIIILSGASPAGGVWSGNGVSGSTFTPQNAGIGNHVITYTYTNAQGCAGSDTRQFLVQSAPAVTAGSNLTVCSSQSSVNLSGGNPFGGVWIGPFVNGTIFNATQAGPGVHLVQYTYTNANGCLATANKEIVVNPGPPVEAGSNLESCAGADPVTLTGASPAGGVWSGPGVVATEFRPRNVSVGSYQITYSFTDTNGCNGTDTRTITVNALPSVNAGPDKSLCENAARFDLSLDATPSGGSYSGIGVSNNFFNPAVSGTGTFRVTYSYSDLSGCNATDTRDITVLPGLPQPTITGPGTVCYGESGTFQATATGANTFTSYKWYLEGDISPFAEGRTISVKVFENMTIYVDAVNRDGCSSRARGEFELLVQDIAGRISASKNDLSTGDVVGLQFIGTTGSKYAWDFGDGHKSTADKPFKYYYFPGTYDIRLDIETLQGCKKTFTEKNFIRVTGLPFDVITGAEPATVQETINIYPTPFEKEISVSVNLQDDGPITLTILSQIGVRAITQTYPGRAGENTLQLNAADLAQGLYLLEVSTQNQKAIKKIIKK